jgi:hypothetical protein
MGFFPGPADGFVGRGPSACGPDWSEGELHLSWGENAISVVRSLRLMAASS